MTHLRVQLGMITADTHPRGGADGRQHVQRGEPGLPHRRGREPRRARPGDRPLLAEPGFILEIDMDLLIGMRRGDGVDLLDDDLLEELLDLGVGCSCWGRGIRLL